ncbi:hypothetical protein TWF506_008343 [Arthrobotrys conoides]|uniref:Uncharacterized protein n=1 Tax=Arthrobotrys conoides TaxID=74498 RepID=A0AAN8ND31_9PEZI
MTSISLDIIFNRHNPTICITITILLPIADLPILHHLFIFFLSPIPHSFVHIITPYLLFIYPSTLSNNIYHPYDPTMPPKDLSFERLCAGSYEANASTLTKRPFPEKALPITLSTYFEKKGKSKPRRFIAIDFTNWKNRRCRLTIPANVVLFNLLTEKVVYIALHDLEKDDKMMLYISNEKSVPNNFSTYTCIDTKAGEVDLMETPPSTVKLEPINLWDVTKELIILRGCTSSPEDQREFFNDIDKDSAQIQIVQKVLDTRSWYWDSDAEREIIQRDISGEQQSSTKKKKAGSRLTGSAPRGEKRTTDFSTDSDSNQVSAPSKPSRRPPKKRQSLGPGVVPVLSPASGNETNNNQTDETQHRDSDVEMDLGQNSKGGQKPSGRKPRVRRGTRGGRRGASERRVVSAPAYGRAAADIEIFEDPDLGDESAQTTNPTNSVDYQPAPPDQELPGLENLHMGNSRGNSRRGYRGGRGHGHRGRGSNIF